MKQEKPKFDYNLFGAFIGFAGIILLLIVMLITNGLKI
jgi:hypothetical protein